MTAADAPHEHWIGDDVRSLEQINAMIAAPILAPEHTWRWWVVFAVFGALTC